MEVAVTQLELKDHRLSTIVDFIQHTRRSRIQAQASQGYLSHGYNIVGGLYTMSAWETRDDVLAFKNSGAHKVAIESSAEIAKGGRTMLFEAAAKPSWPEAKARLREEGRDLKDYLAKMSAIIEARELAIKNGLISSKAVAPERYGVSFEHPRDVSL